MQAKKSFSEIGKRILSVLKWLTVFVYLGLIVGFMYLAHQWNASWLYPQLNVDLIVRVGVLFGLIPVIGLVILFYKGGQKWYLTVKAVVQGIFIVSLPALALVFLGILPIGMWSSVTTDIDNYHVFEEDAEKHMTSLTLNILPSSLPQNIEETSYSYHYLVAIDSLMTVNASWKYLDEEDYEQEKERLLQKEILDTYEENGYMVCKMKLGSGINNTDNSAEFGYNDETRSVFYRIDGVW